MPKKKDRTRKTIHLTKIKEKHQQSETGKISHKNTNSKCGSHSMVSSAFKKNLKKKKEKNIKPLE